MFAYSTDKPQLLRADSPAKIKNTVEEYNAVLDGSYIDI